jgi:ribosomal protein S27AE
MSSKAELKFENYSEYFGGVEKVKKTIDDCPVCGAKLLLSHLPDYRNLLIQENARCLDCGESHRKVIHVLN